MILNAATLAATTRGFKVIFDQAFGAIQPSWGTIAMEVPSESSEEQYAWLSSIPQFREWLGERQIQNLATSDFTIRNKDFENTIEVDRNAIQDDKIGVYKPLISQLGQSASVHPDVLAYGLLKAGFTSLCYDGQYFFDSDHAGFDANGDAASVSNVQTGAGDAWFLIASRGAIKPIIYQKRQPYNFVALDDPHSSNLFFKKKFIYGVDARCNVGYGLWQLAFGSKAALDVTNYPAARAAMGSLYNAGGQPMGIIPDTLLVGPSNEGAARALVEASTLANGATNPWKDTAKVVMSPWLA